MVSRLPGEPAIEGIEAAGGLGEIALRLLRRPNLQLGAPKPIGGPGSSVRGKPAMREASKWGAASSGS